MNLVEAFLAQVAEAPERPAIITGEGRSVSYAQISSAAAARAAAMRRAGVGAGDVVLVARGVSPELYEILIALFRIGAVAMFPEPAAGVAGVRAAVQAARPKAVAGGWLARLLRFAVPELAGARLVGGPTDGASDAGALAVTGEEAPALITFTSGSTGRPKGIVRSSGFLMLQHTLLERVRATQPGDVELISLPVFVLSNLAAGATSVLPRGRLSRPARLDGGAMREAIRSHGVSRITAPPAVCQRIVETGGPIEGLAAVFTGGGPVFPNLLRALSDMLPEGEVHAVYGSTEAEPIAHVRARDISANDWNGMAEGQGLLAGRPVAEARVVIRDDEIRVAGPHVNRGYLDPTDDASTKVVEDGVLWHRTGDAGRMGADGRLWLLGRLAAASGGIFPFAVETAALSWPGVRAAALLAGGGRARLAVAGEGLSESDLRVRAKALGDIEPMVLRSIPMDRRHNSKVDYARLRAALK